MLGKRKLSEEAPPSQQRGCDHGRVRVSRLCSAASVTSALQVADGNKRRGVAVCFPSTAGPELPGATAVTVLSFTDWRALERSNDDVKLQLAHVWCALDTHTLALRPDEDGELSELRGPDLRWHALLRQLEVRRQVLLEMTAHISTLGGGWASVGQRAKAHRYAYQQKRVARLLGDETLELLSDVYIAYGHLAEGRVELSRNLIAEQFALAQRRGEKRQLAIVDAARIQLAKVDAAAGHK